MKPLSRKSKFQHTAARRRLAKSLFNLDSNVLVSTHSRPKAAGDSIGTRGIDCDGFNTQPPEGGWLSTHIEQVSNAIVSTHSRPKAAGASLKSLAPSGFVAPISLSPQEKREREYNTAFSVIPAFAIS